MALIFYGMTYLAKIRVMIYQQVPGIPDISFCHVEHTVGTLVYA